jgi:hypothetical protein
VTKNSLQQTGGDFLKKRYQITMMDFNHFRKASKCGAILILTFLPIVAFSFLLSDVSCVLAFSSPIIDGARDAI